MNENNAIDRLENFWMKFLIFGNQVTDSMILSKFFSAFDPKVQAK